ncbi:phosphotyrosine protein phosphatases superfamily protein [Striga asiatica]|uniref:Phosphotyrosine protein phosphatases superfamily protein n=1 Tax=Striga asiatica TaxID=4170 RepID=A0A5A7QLA1_STRAF|nr:phosphotyrosine protein phosphatases superfamily protein [Striga asiatica]
MLSYKWWDLRVDTKGGSDQWAKGPQEVKNKTLTNARGEKRWLSSSSSSSSLLPFRPYLIPNHYASSYRLRKFPWSDLGVTYIRLALLLRLTQLLALLIAIARTRIGGTQRSINPRIQKKRSEVTFDRPISRLPLPAEESKFLSASGGPIGKKEDLMPSGLARIYWDVALEESAI